MVRGGHRLPDRGGGPASQLARRRRGALPSPVTSAYTDFLLATALGEDRTVGVAAVLPCFWLYAHVGAQLPAVPAEHPYAAWLDTYRDPGFVAATEAALRQLERELAAASPAVRAQAARAYLTACRHELEFFDQALRLEPPAPEPRAIASAAATLVGGAR
ncbi:hypothetical protein [Brachybacterium sp. UNK5269]|uniref:hypothetical protein n=1 Tax=Brachybacterium sp. UNK5269 TaxID=3408576 RepID=UPI003BB07550